MSISYVNKFLMVLVALVPLLCLGCGEPGLDTSNDQAYNESLGVIYEAIPEGERAEFRENYSAVLSEKIKIGSRALNEKDIYQVYTMITAFGKDKDKAALASFNGLTLSQITQQGQEFRSKKIEGDIKDLKEEITALEKKVADDQMFAKALTQVEVTIDKLEATEGADNFGSKRPWGKVGLFTIYLTIKNNSPLTVNNIKGGYNITDGEGNKMEKGYRSLRNIQPIGGHPEGFMSGLSSLNIASGAEWKGKTTYSPGRTSNKYIFPPAKPYQTILSNIEVVLDSDVNRSEYSVESRVLGLKRAQKNLIALEKELASFN